MNLEYIIDDIISYPPSYLFQATDLIFSLDIDNILHNYFVKYSINVKNNSTSFKFFLDKDIVDETELIQKQNNIVAEFAYLIEKLSHHQVNDVVSDFENYYFLISFSN